MRSFVQLKDGIGFAVVNTSDVVEGIEVEYGTGEQYLKKKYENGAWLDAPVYWYAEINYNGLILEIKKTHFVSDIGDRPIVTPDIDPTARWIDGKWVTKEGTSATTGDQVY